MKKILVVLTALKCFNASSCTKTYLSEDYKFKIEKLCIANN